MLYSPLEQFEIIPLITFRLNSFDLSFTNSSFYIIFCIVVFIFISNCIFIKGGFFVPNRWQALFEGLYTFVLKMVSENIGSKEGRPYFPLVFSLFLFLLLCNLVGLVPYSFTVTSHFIVTFMLSFFVWFGKLILGFRIHGIKLFGMLLPGGLPFILVPFFVGVEFISFLIPLISLGVRLFANIMAGHILLKVIVGFCWIILISGSLYLAHFVPLFVLFLLLFLETAVAFIQAYVFTILTCLYLGDILRGGHLFLSLVAQWLERLAVN